MKLVFYISDENKYLNKEHKALIKRSICDTLCSQTEFEKFEASVVITGNDEIQQINLQHRDIDKPTDVLSFPSCDDGVDFPLNPDNGCFVLGDIVISFEKAVSQALEYGHPLERELAFLTVHGCLHLLGYDHERSKEDELEMFKLQERILKNETHTGHIQKL